MDKLFDRQSVGVYFRGTDGYYGEMFNTGIISVDFDEGLAQIEPENEPPLEEQTVPVDGTVPDDGAAVGDTTSVQGPGEEHTDKETVRTVQTALNAAGYDCGTPDGIAGKNTKRAIISYQADNGLVETGTVTDELLRALGLL